jgi:hypothetical protein
MIETYSVIHPRDSSRQPFVLRAMTSERIGVTGEYAHLICKRCDKINEKAALALGIRADVVVKSKRSILRSSEDFYILDDRAKGVFTTLFPDALDYFQIPSSPLFFVATARVCIQPHELNPGFRFACNPCGLCGRPGEVVWGKEPLVVPERRRLIAVNLEGRGGARGIFLVSPEAAKELKAVSPQLSGMVLSPRQIDVQSPT